MFLWPYFVPTVCSKAICQPCRISINQDDINASPSSSSRFATRPLWLSFSAIKSALSLSRAKLVENITFQRRWLKFWFGSIGQKAQSCSEMRSNLISSLRELEPIPETISTMIVQPLKYQTLFDCWYFQRIYFLLIISNCRKMLSWSCQFISRNVHTNAVCLSSDKLMERRLFMGTSRYLVFISTSPNGVWHATASLWQLWYNVTMSQCHNVTLSPCHDNTMS